MKIGDRVFIHGYVDEVRQDTVIIRNNGGYFGTDLSEVIPERRGTWKEVRDESEDPLFRRKWVCSCCGSWQTYGKSKFCPNCGADMRDLAAGYAGYLERKSKGD